MSNPIPHLNQAASAIDPALIPCPDCGGQLRAEYKAEWRSTAEVCEMFGVTVPQLLAAGCTLDSFGRVAAGVPYVTCMGCGLHVDGSQEPVIIE